MTASIKRPLSCHTSRTLRFPALAFKTDGSPERRVIDRGGTTLLSYRAIDQVATRFERTGETGLSYETGIFPLMGISSLLSRQIRGAH